MSDSYKNFAYSTVLTAPSPATSGTTLVVASGDGALFPTPPFNATVWATGVQPTATGAEIVRVTNISTDTLTITRATESSSARTIVVGDQIAATITAKALTDLAPLSGNLSQFAATTSAQLKSVLSDETGSGSAVFATSPALTTPTGIVKGDVGLGNVDNTSDSTKNSAVASLTNKDVTSGTNTFPTFNQNTTGSAAKLTTPRTINGTSFDGSANVTVTAAAGTLTGTTLNSTVVTSSLTSTGTLGGLTVTAAPTFSAMTAGSILLAGTAGLLSQDNTNFIWDSTNHNLRIGPTSSAITTENRLSVIGNANDYHGTYVSNLNAGTTASSDMVVANDLGPTDANAYFDVGVNSSGNTNAGMTLFGGSDVYMFTGPGGGLNNINIATGTTGKVMEFSLPQRPHVSVASYWSP